MPQLRAEGLYAPSFLAIVFVLLGLSEAFAVNNPPTIGVISNQTVLVDQPTVAIKLALSDTETPVLDLQLSGTSSDTNLVPVGNIFFGDVTALSNRYVTVTPAFGKIGTATITVTVSDGTNSANANFMVTANPPPPGAARFVSLTSIAIPDVGIATPYPSAITVTGMSGTITNLILTVSKFSHQFSKDVNMLLVGPTGQGVIIFSHIGEGLTTNVTFTLTDASLFPLPSDFALWPEPLKPAAYAPSVSFPGATVGPYGPVALSTFNGLPANGTWSLYVYDDEAPDHGIIAGGWSLMVATTGGGSSPPSITDIPGQLTTVGVPTAAIPFTINDVDTPISNLTLNVNSSNLTLVPLANIVLGGSGANRTVTVNPATGQNGTATITVAVSDGVNSNSSMFSVTVSTPPKMSGIVNQTTNEDTPAGPIAFTVVDAETPAGSLTVSGFSSNPTLVPTNNIVFGGSGENRTVTLIPALNQFGSATITLTVSDGLLSTNASFLLTVNSVNDAPTMSAIPAQTTLMGRALGPFLFDVSDVETPANDLIVTAMSSNTNLVPNENVILFHFPSSPDWTLTVAPVDGQTGTTTITAIVGDGEASTSNSFQLTVSLPGPGMAIYDNPSSITIPDAHEATPYPSTINVTGIVGTIRRVTVTLKDLSHTYPDDINMLLVGPSGQKVIIFSRAGGGDSVSNVTVTLSDDATFPLPDEAMILAGTYQPTDYGHINPFPAPAPAGPYATTLSAFNGQSPNGVWSLYVYDEFAPDRGVISNGWSLAITTQSPPTISSITNQTTALDTPTAAIPFTINDLETPASNLTLSASSSDPTLAPTNNIVFGGSGTNRTATITPASNQVGSVTIALTVSDGELTASNSFALTVVPAQLTVAGIVVSNKIYDGSTAAALNMTGAMLVGVHGSASVTLNTGAVTGTFGSKHSGTGKVVSVTGLTITGADTNKYTLTQPTAIADITARAIDVSAVTDSKVYDGTMASSGVPTITPGLVAGDTSGFTQEFNDKHMGTGKRLTPAGSVSDGHGGANYDVTFIKNTTGVITVRPITVMAVTDSKTYDGTMASAGVPLVTIGSLAPGDTSAFTQAFADKNVGTGKTMIPAGSVNDGHGGTNYTVTLAINTTGIITPTLLTVTADDKNRPYGVANPVLTASYSGFAGGETLATSGVTGNPVLSTPAINTSPASNYPITVVIGSLSASNYTFSLVNGTLTVFGGPPVILSFTRTGTTNVLVIWSAISNVTYRLQYKPNFNDTNWLDLVPDITASSGIASATDNPSNVTQRFYRVKVVP